MCAHPHWNNDEVDNKNNDVHDDDDNITISEKEKETDNNDGNDYVGHENNMFNCLYISNK